MNHTLKAEKILIALKDFDSKATEALQLKNTISRGFDSEITKLRNEKQNESKLLSDDLPRSASHMIYYDLKDGHARSFGRKRLYLDDLISAAHHNKNRHYQWVLVEAYEAFEDYLEHAYAAFGYVDSDFWPMSDFGSCKISEISSFTFDWHLNQVKSKKGKPTSILSTFRKTLPNIRSIERENKLSKNLAFELCLIPKLRHLIVHNSGKVENLGEITKKTLDEANINPKDHDFFKNAMNSYFGRRKDTGETVVTLVEEAIEGTIGHHDKVGHLIRLLVSYAHTLTEESIRHLYNKGLIPTTESESMT